MFMKTKILSILAILMMALTVQAATITVTWNASDIVTVNPWDKSFTKDGITFAPGHADFLDKNFTNGGTFTTASGKFTKIEVTAPYVDISGTGWSGGSWTGDASSSVFTIEMPNAATLFDLTLADGSDAHGTVAFTVDGAAATQAQKDDVVTVSVTPAEGYSTKVVTVRAYTTWAGAPARAKSRAAAPELKDDIDVTAGENGTWTFTMPEANVWVVVTYTKNLQDAWIEAIADQTYTGEAITPTVIVKDGETTLTAGTDYTVAYADNTDAGTATVTITAVAGSDYSGTASKTFTIAKAAGSISYAETSVSKTFGDEAFTNELTMTGDGIVTYASDNVNVAVVDSETGLVTITGTGTATIKATVADGNNYTYVTKTAQYTLTVTADKTALNAAISEAETYYESIKETNPDAAAVLKEAIDAAKTVQGNANATQSEVETATQTLNDAVAAAQTEVAKKRVSITIPAKSYVARIDADKGEERHQYGGGTDRRTERGQGRNALPHLQRQRRGSDRQHRGEQ